jgi:hypothetical protein
VADQFTPEERAEVEQIAADLVRAAEAAQFAGDEMSSREWRENAQDMTVAVLRGLAAQDRRVHGDTRAAATLDLIADAVEQGR